MFRARNPLVPPTPLLIAAVTVAAGLVGAFQATAVDAQQAERLMLGVMRRDGVIVPFAAHDGDWSIPWPVNLRNVEVPVTLDGIPKRWWGGGDMPQKWTLWGPGGEPVPLTVAAPVLVIAGREKRLGLRTNFLSSEALPGPFELPYPKDGLAIAGDVKVESIPAVSRQSAAFRNLTTSLLADIEEAEHKTANRLKGSVNWSHPFSREFRRGIPPTLEAWYTSGLEQPGFGVSYIEAVKKYPPGPEDAGCGLETFISGWVHTNTRTQKPRTELAARITFCDRAGVSYLLPLGRMRVKDRTHWVLQMSSWESEWYAVVEITPGRTRFVAEYYGGGRPRPY